MASHEYGDVELASWVELTVKGGRGNPPFLFWVVHYRSFCALLHSHGG